MEAEDLDYNVSYRDVKYPRLELKTGNLLLVLPHGQDPSEIAEKHRDWINQKTELIRTSLEDSTSKKIFEREDGEFKDVVRLFAEKISRELDVSVNRIYFRKMKTKWASCSSKGNLTVNTLLGYLPEELIEYVVLHEIAHLIERRHNDRFWGIISTKFGEYQKMEKDLFAYWFLIRSTGDID
jgi:predicted metal-dependent hydrolase